MPENFARNLRDLSGDIRLQSTAGTPDATHRRTLARGARRRGEAQLAPEAAAGGHRGGHGGRGFLLAKPLTTGHRPFIHHLLMAKYKRSRLEHQAP